MKSLAVIGLFCLVGAFSPQMPAFGVALCWACMSAASAVGFVYRAAVKKEYDLGQFNPGHFLWWVQSGRVLSLVIGFVLSAVFMAGILLGVPTWGMPEFALAVAAIPLFALVYAVANGPLRTQFTKPYRAAGSIRGCWMITAALLCVAYALLCALLPGETYASAVDAYKATANPFEGSTSALMVDAGILLSFVDAMRAYGLSAVSGDFPLVYVAWKVALNAAALCGVSNLLSICVLEWSELRRAFVPLRQLDRARAQRPVLSKGYLALAAALPVVLVAAFLVADHEFASYAETDEYSSAKELVRDRIGLVVYALDGNVYDKQAVQDALDDAHARSEELVNQAQEDLVPLINASFDARIANVDGYLDWYYSLPGDYERLVGMITGSVDDFVSDQFTASIEQGIDDTQLLEAWTTYVSQSEQVRTDLMAEIADCEISGIPDWLIVSEESISLELLEEPLEPTNKLLEAEQRFAISGTAGIVGSVLVGKVIAKESVQKVLTKVMQKITTKLASRGIGSVAGGAVGTVGGPPGVVAGIAAGTAIAVGVDYVLLAVDEAQNRESYRAEIVSAIEEQRAEMLAPFGQNSVAN